MPISYYPLQLEDDGRVFDLCASAFIGHIDEPAPDRQIADQWEWLAQEHADAQRAALGYRQAQHDAYLGHVGAPS